jgi:hypothetical protein
LERCFGGTVIFSHGSGSYDRFLLMHGESSSALFFSYIAVTTVLGLEKGKDCIIVGTLYKHMKLKPSILDEYAKEVKCLES